MTDINVIPKTPGLTLDTEQGPPVSPLPDNEIAHLLANLHHDTPHTPSPPPTLYLPVDQLQQLLQTVLSHHLQGKSKDDNPLNQARLEHFISQGTTLKFDSDQDKLVPWIKRFRSLRTNAVWQSATYVKDDVRTFDLLTEFTKVMEAIIRDQASAR
jgi:hypothetical protein